HWAYWNQVQLDFSRPGKPVDNAFIEAFNASLRRECLSQHWFLSVEDAQRTLDLWKEDYNNNRPHSEVGGVVNTGTPVPLDDRAGCVIRFRPFGTPNGTQNLNAYRRSTGPGCESASEKNLAASLFSRRSSDSEMYIMCPAA